MADLSGLVPVIIGALILIFNDGLSRLVISSQNKTWGHRFGARGRLFVRLLWITGGVFSGAIGILGLFGFIQLNR